MAEGFIDKKIGPFSGGAWVLIVVGGVGLAFLIRRGMGGGGKKETEPLLAIETQTAPRVFGDVGQYGGAGGTPLENPPNVPPPVVPPTQPRPGVPSPPSTPAPAQPPIAILPIPSGFGASASGVTVNLKWNALPSGLRVQINDITNIATPAAVFRGGPGATTGTFTGKPNTTYVLRAYSFNEQGRFSIGSAPVTVRTGGAAQPPATPAPGNVPGGFPTGCQGVIGFPIDYPGNSAQMLAKVHSSNNPDQTVGKYFGWTIGGVGSAPIPTKLQAAKAFVGNRLNWPLINQTRRTRGLGAMTSEQFAQMSAQINTQAQSGRDSFPDSFLAAMWDRWYEPFICRNPPRALGAKNA